MRRKLTWAAFAPGCYWGATYLLRFVLVILGRWTVTGRENVPATGAVIVVSNHLNNADPPILAAGIVRRRIRYMAKIQLFKYPFGIVPRLYGAFPVRRFEADLAALLNAERILKAGGVIGMFPEGTRSRTGLLGKPHPGTALIALRSGAMVLPCAVIGTEQLGNPLNILRKPKISIQIGRPISIAAVRRPSEAQVSELTEQIFAEIRSLLPPKYVAAYTGSEEAATTHDGANSSSK
jgi:1-acyl-sn-glycerol-3-phosphate acyltransferase